MRNAVIDGQFQHLRVDHDHPAFFRAQLVKQAQDHRVDRHGFTGTGCTRDQQVGHLGQVRHNRIAADVLAQGQRQTFLVAIAKSRLDRISRSTTFSRFSLGSSMPITLRPGTVETRADRAAIERAISSARPITRRGLEARCGFQLVHGDNGAGAHGDDLTFDAIVIQHGFQACARFLPEPHLTDARRAPYSGLSSNASGGNSKPGCVSSKDSAGCASACACLEGCTGLRTGCCTTLRGSATGIVAWVPFFHLRAMAKDQQCASSYGFSHGCGGCNRGSKRHPRLRDQRRFQSGGSLSTAALAARLRVARCPGPARHPGRDPALWSSVRVTGVCTAVVERTRFLITSAILLLIRSSPGAVLLIAPT